MKPFHCKKCQNIVGITDGTDFYFNGSPVIPRPDFIRFSCPFCSKRVEWRAVANKVLTVCQKKGKFEIAEIVLTAK